MWKRGCATALQSRERGRVVNFLELSKQLNNKSITTSILWHCSVHNI
jgi:hypothetical protein